MKEFLKPTKFKIFLSIVYSLFIIPLFTWPNFNPVVDNEFFVFLFKILYWPVLLEGKIWEYIGNTFFTCTSHEFLSCFLYDLPEGKYLVLFLVIGFVILFLYLYIIVSLIQFLKYRLHHHEKI